MNILIIEPYFGGSHKAWAEGYQIHSEHNVEIISDTYELWRQKMRTSGKNMAELTNKLADTFKPDVIICSDFVNVEQYKQNLNKKVDAKVILFFHENQLCYPINYSKRLSKEFSSINWRSAIAADEILFNSQFHYVDFFSAIGTYLEKVGDSDALSNEDSTVISEVKEKSAVAGIGVDLEKITNQKRVIDESQKPTIGWNLRWDYDKNPKEFITELSEFAETADFELTLLGEDQGDKKSKLLEDHENLQSKISGKDYIESKEAYYKALNQIDIFVSTAEHEYFGIATVEAIASGAIVILPNKLNYPELLGSDFSDDFLYEEGELQIKLADVFNNFEGYASKALELADTMGRFSWINVAETYDKLLSE